MAAAHSSYVYFFSFENELHPWALHDAYQTASNEKADLCVFNSTEVNYARGGKESSLMTPERLALFPQNRPFSLKDFDQRPFEAVNGWLGDKLFRQAFLAEREIRFAEMPEEAGAPRPRLRDALFVLTAFVKAERVSMDDRAPVIRITDDDWALEPELSAERLTGLLSLMPELNEASAHLRRSQMDMDLSAYLTGALAVAVSSFQMEIGKELMYSWMHRWSMPSAARYAQSAQEQQRNGRVLFQYKAEPLEAVGVPLFSISLPPLMWKDASAQVDFLFLSDNQGITRDTLYLSCVNFADTAGTPTLFVRQACWEYGETLSIEHIAYLPEKNKITVYAKHTGQNTGVAYQIRMLTARMEMPGYEDLTEQSDGTIPISLPSEAIFIIERLCGARKLSVRKRRQGPALLAEEKKTEAES